MVLVVDDERSIRQLVRRVLSAAGHDVLVADAAEHALRLFENDPGAIDLLVTDLVMPDMSGRALAERVRRLRPDLPILYMSGDPASIVEPEALPPGIFFLPKPFEAETLSAAVDEARCWRGS